MSRDLFGRLIEEQEEIDAPRSQDQPLGWKRARYAEFMVCAYLTKMGHHAVHVDTIGFDIILDYEGRSYRIDVKSTDYYYHGPFKESVQWHLKKNGGRFDAAQQKTQRNLTPHDADLLALYHVTFDTVVFYPVLRPLKEVRLPGAQVRNAGIGEASLAIAISQLKGRGAF